MRNIAIGFELGVFFPLEKEDQRKSQNQLVFLDSLLLARWLIDFAVYVLVREERSLGSVGRTDGQEEKWCFSEKVFRISGQKMCVIANENP